MRIIQSPMEMAALAGQPPRVLVPTMGALHAGHAKLVREARALAGTTGTVVVSIFVNPTQFGPGEDFEDYPRDLEADRAICTAAGADVIFHPSAADIYAADASIEVRESRLSQQLCGASRPGHFAGVCTVVTKLLNLVAPDIAVFGKKDYQQLVIIRRLVRDLNMRVQIHGADTVRESDGLAMSSRNLYLSAGERAQAAAIRRALLAAREEAQAQPGLPGEALLAGVEARLAAEAPLGRVDYLELVDAESLERIAAIGGRKALLAAAVFFGKTRLIDNLELPADRSGGPPST